MENIRCAAEYGVTGVMQPFVRDRADLLAVRQALELTPAGMIRTLGLDKPIFAQFCNYGHFTHQDAPWEQCDRADLLWNVCRVKEAGVSSR